MASKRGFASMDPARIKQIASMGGKAVPASKRSFSTNPQLAAAAGRKGGMSVKPENRKFRRDREYAAECGRKGGQVSKTKEVPTDETVPDDTARSTAPNPGIRRPTG